MSAPSVCPVPSRAVTVIGTPVSACKGLTSSRLLRKAVNLGWLSPSATWAGRIWLWANWTCAASVPCRSLVGAWVLKGKEGGTWTAANRGPLARAAMIRLANGVFFIVMVLVVMGMSTCPAVGSLKDDRHIRPLHVTGAARLVPGPPQRRLPTRRRPLAYPGIPRSDAGIQGLVDSPPLGCEEDPLLTTGGHEVAVAIGIRVTRVP